MTSLQSKQFFYTPSCRTLALNPKRRAKATAVPRDRGIDGVDVATSAHDGMAAVATGISDATRRAQRPFRIA